MGLPAEAESLIVDAPVSAHVATSVDDRPHVAPVWYGYRDGVLYCITGGKKLENLRRNPRVAVSIEEADGEDVAWNVTLLGRVTVSEDPDRIDWASEWIYDRYDDADGNEDVEADEDADSDGERGSGADDGSGNESDGPEGEYALVEIEIGSASYAVYE